MSLFSNILEKLGLKKPAAPAPKPGPTATATATVKPTPSARPWEPTGTSPTPKAIIHHPHANSAQVERNPPCTCALNRLLRLLHQWQMVDVVSKLEKLAKDNGGKLKWKASIVDLLKLLGIESSLAARKELAVELGCPPEKMKDSVNMNIWLHKTVLQKIAENGGNIPKELLD